MVELSNHGAVAQSGERSAVNRKVVGIETHQCRIFVPIVVESYHRESL